MRDNVGLKVAISLGALAVIIVRALWPGLNIDAVTLGLILVAILPWLSGLIKSAEFPGGWKIEFQDIKKAGERVVSEPPLALGVAEQGTPYVPDNQPSFLAVAPQDPNLALVGLRIEIEKRVRALAEKRGIPPSRPLSTLIRDLRSEGALAGSSASGLQELVTAGNQAAHGARVDREVADWAIQYGPGVLATLDDKLAS